MLPTFIRPGLGDETSAPLFIQCVMWSRTGTSALSALPVRLKAGEILFFANRKSYFLSVISGYSVR